KAITTMMGKDNGRQGNLDMVTGFFTIRGLNFIREVMADDTTFRMVLAKIAGNPSGKDGHCAIDLLSEDNGIEAMLNLSEDAKKAVEFLSRDKVAIRAITSAFCHAKSYIFKDKNQTAFDSYITGSSNLTDAGLGLVETRNVELNVAEMGHSDTFNAHQQWFNELWKGIKGNEMIPSDPNDPKSLKISVKQYFINLITDTILKTYTPEDIYYKILYEYFKSEIDVESAEMEKDINLLQNTAIYKTLFDFQQKGVISLIKMLEKYDGAILADAVGLGKTFSALAVMWYFQNKGYTVAVFCPKKLQTNWEQYQYGAGSRFDNDRLLHIVDFHTDLQGDRLAKKTKGSLSYLQNQNKLLIVIDESHNLRSDDSDRYKQLLGDIIQYDDNRRIVKVLQLSATPINNKLTDIRNQFNLIGHGNDNAFEKEFDVESLKKLFTDAQGKYKAWTEDSHRTVGSLIQKLPTRFFDLTDRLIVARTRKMVEEATQSDFGFPKQREPENIYIGINKLGAYNSFEEIYDALLASNLTAYKPSMYMGNVNRGDWQDDSYREASLVKMMATLFAKRLESSWYACLKTIEKVLNVHKETLRRVKACMASGHYGSWRGIPIDIIYDDEDEAIDTETSLDKNRIQLSEMADIARFKQDLEHDVKCLEEFYENICAFKEQFDAGKVKDEKLEELKARIIQKQHSNGNKKIIIFTAFADTAEYLYNTLAKDLALRAKMACVTGQRTFTPEGSTKKFGEVLQRFAPMSKLFKEKDWSNHYARLDDDFYASHYDAEKQKWNVAYDEWKGLLPKISPADHKLMSKEIDILIATDCLSEGQNLQDADLVVNYDIHWNPVRLI
ncbi:MAG: DEAD/DEAH box helicase family protein, partial [Bacteroidales bacterium]|nr:DEAD/DEAH box helicase family protein [Bacteroidales bacterium]